MPGGDFRKLPGGMGQHVTEPPSAHGGAGEVQNVHQALSPGLGMEGPEDLQVGQRPGV